MIDTPEADNLELRMNDYSMVVSASCSLAKECKRLCDVDERVNDVKGYNQHKKREDN